MTVSIVKTGLKTIRLLTTMHADVLFVQHGLEELGVKMGPSVLKAKIKQRNG